LGTLSPSFLNRKVPYWRDAAPVTGRRSSKHE
jgi:hypothetical protein